MDQASYDQLVQDRVSHGELQPHAVNMQTTTTNLNATPASRVPHAVTTTPTAPSDSPSATTTPTHQVNTAQIMPSPGGPTSTHMDSGPPSLLHQMLSNASTRSQQLNADGTINATYDGHQYNIQRINHTSYRYSYDFNENRIQSVQGALVDSGANGGMAGPDTCLLSVVPNAHVHITGISGEPIEKLQLVQCAAAMEMLDEGMIILIMSQYAHAPTGKTIHSKSQLEYFGCSVHDSSRQAGGKQCIYTPEGYVILHHVQHGLFYMDMHPPTDDKLCDYPHVFLTADSAWNPASMDGEFPRDLNSDNILTNDKLLQNLRHACDPRVDAFGNLTLHLLDYLQDGTHSSEELFHDNYKHTETYTVSRLDRCLNTITILGTHMK